MAHEFDQLWICPNIKELELYGDPLFMQFSDGKSLVMIVNSCSVAKRNDSSIKRFYTDATGPSELDMNDKEERDEIKLLMRK